MHYIVFDLEFNRDTVSLQNTGKSISQYPFEIIQIGAIKLNSTGNAVATFNRYVKPSIYTQISPFVTELTNISTDQLLNEAPFTEVLDNFINFIGDDEYVFCTWGMSDMKELFKNIEYHKLNKKRLSEMFINLQPYVSTYLNLPQTKLLNLQFAVESLGISAPYQFHNALYDAFYTAKIFKKLSSTDLQPKRYDPTFVSIKPRQPKKIIDFEKLLQQFEKMYARELSKEEQDMIQLAYKMGKTNQFIR